MKLFLVNPNNMCTFATDFKTIKDTRNMVTVNATRYINPYTDFGFKKLFGTELNKDLLISFLNALFNNSEKEIEVIRNSEDYDDYIVISRENEPLVREIALGIFANYYEGR